MKIRDYRDVIRRTYDGLPVSDAKRDLYIVVDEGAIARAKKKNPGECAIALGAGDSLHATKVAIGKEIGYCDVMDEEGNREVWRFELDKPTRKFIEDFDRGKRVKPGGFWLRVPRNHRSLDKQREYSKAFYHRKQEVVFRGTIESSDAPRSRRPRVVDLTVRNCSGTLSHMKPA